MPAPDGNPGGMRPWRQDPVTFAVLGFLVAYAIAWLFVGVHVDGLLPAPPTNPAERLAIGIGVIGMVLFFAIWRTGVEDAPVPTRHPWLLRMFETPWTDWDALSWEEKMGVHRVRQTVTWVLAGLTLMCMFVPMLMVAGIV